MLVLPLQLLVLSDLIFFDFNGESSTSLPCHTQKDSCKLKQQLNCEKKNGASLILVSLQF